MVSCERETRITILKVSTDNTHTTFSGFSSISLFPRPPLTELGGVVLRRPTNQIVEKSRLGFRASLLLCVRVSSLVLSKTLLWVCVRRYGEEEEEGDQAVVLVS